MMFGAIPSGMFAPAMRPNSLAAVDPSAMDFAPAPQVTKDPSFFGQGGTGRNIAGHIGDALLQMNRIGPIYAPAMQQQQGMAARQQMAEAERAASWQDWVAKQQYQAANPGPSDDVFTRSLIAAGIDPASAEAKSLYRQRVGTMASPAPNFISDGLGGGQWVQPPAPGAIGPSLPSVPVGKLTPIGGATPGGSRTF